MSLFHDFTFKTVFLHGIENTKAFFHKNGKGVDSSFHDDSNNI